MLLPFFHPSTIILAGPTMCGKTQFLVNVLINKLIDPWPERLVLVYDEMQNAYKLLRNKFPHLELIKGPMRGDLYEGFSPTVRNLLILDDQLTSSSDSTDLKKYFVQGAHHRNLSVIFILQNIFEKGKAMRTSSLNTNYFVLFKNPRDKQQISILAKQIFPSKSKNFLKAYEDATEEPYSYVLVDMRQDTPEECRVRTDFLPQAGKSMGALVYII